MSNVIAFPINDNKPARIDYQKLFHEVSKQADELVELIKLQDVEYKKIESLLIRANAKLTILGSST